MPLQKIIRLCRCGSRGWSTPPPPQTTPSGSAPAMFLVLFRDILLRLIESFCLNMHLSIKYRPIGIITLRNTKCLITRSACAGASSATGIPLSGKGVAAPFAVFNENKGYP